MGKPQYASDLYSLGVTCLSLLTGIEPFTLFDAGDNSWVWRDYLVDNPVSEDLGKILDKLTQQGYQKRYQSANELLFILTEGEKETKIADNQKSVVLNSNDRIFNVIKYIGKFRNELP